MTNKTKLITIITATVITFILSLSFFIFSCWYAGFDIFIRNKTNADNLFFSIVFSGFISGISGAITFLIIDIIKN